MSRLRIRTDGTGFTVLLGFLAALPALSIDINIPAALVIQQELATSATAAGLTLTLFMVGFAGGQFGAGAASDRWGRRPVLVTGLSVYIVAALGCAFSPTAEALIGWRLIQGLAAGSCAVIAFAMIRDLFEGDVARSKRSYVAVVFSLAPMLAPTIGAGILGLAGWRPIFTAMMAGGMALLLVVVFGVDETRPSLDDRPQLAFHRAYLAVLSDGRFAALVVINALSYGALFAYIAGSALVLMGTFQLSAQGYAAFFACMPAALTVGAWTSGRCAKAGVGSATLLWVGLGLAALTATAMSILAANGSMALWLLVPLLLVNMFCRGLVSPNAQHLALEPMRHHAGTAAGVLGVVQMLVGALASLIVAVLVVRIGPLGMTGTMAGLAVLSFGLWVWLNVGPGLERKREAGPLEPVRAE